MRVPPQRSLVDCLRQRPESLPSLDCHRLTFSELMPLLQQGKQGDRIHIYDFPAGVTEQVLREAIPYFDIMLIPTSPSSLDLNALTHHVFALADAYQNNEKCQFGIVINRYRRVTRQHQQLLSLYEHIAIPTIVCLRETLNYSLSAQNGIGVMEMPFVKAKVDMDALGDIYKWMMPVLPKIANFNSSAKHG